MTNDQKYQLMMIEANAHFSQGNIQKATSLLKKVLNKHPTSPDALLGLTLVYRQSGRIQEALKTVSKLTRLQPDNPQTHQLKGEIFQDLKEFDQAFGAYRKVLELSPESVIALNNLGTLSGTLGNYDEGLKYLRKAQQLEPNHHQINGNLGAALMWAGDHTEAMHYFQQAAQLYVHASPLPSVDAAWPLSHIIHDHEQIQYLIDRGKVDATNKDYAEALKAIVDCYQGQRKVGEKRFIKLDEHQLKALAPSFNQIVHAGSAPRLDGSAINPKLNSAEIENDYRKTFPEILYIDDMLTEEALQSLYQFCLESTTFKRSYSSGYVGSMLAEGFASPLLLQVGDELRKKLPGIFGDHQLMQAWAYKYDSQLFGINVHADFAAVNVNFWISPEEGNLDKEGGGLIVWDSVCPADWSPDDYNRNEQKINDFLKQKQAKSITVPFRRNRAVIFNSALFHRTDNIHFQDNYADRRINVTFLYGVSLERGVQAN